MSYNQKPPGPGGSGMGGGIPPNGPNNSQQVAKTLAGIQQQMQSLVHGQNALPQSSQADLNVFLQQQRFQNMLKQQQLLHFQMQQQQQHQHQQQHQQKDRGGGGGSVGIGGGVGSGVGGGEPLALTRTPAAAELLNKTFQQHQQQQPNGSAAAPNAALNQFQQQLQALPPNIIQQLQTLQYQMQQHQQQQQQQHQHQQQHQQQQQHPPQLTQPQHHPTHQQTPPPSSQQQQPQPLLTAHQQQQLHGQLQHQQQKALQQFQQSLRYFPTAAPTQATAASPQPPTSVGGNKSGSTAPPPQHPQPPPSATIGSNQSKAPNLPPSTQITPVPGNVGSIGMIPGSIAQQQHQTVKTTAGNTSAPVQTTTAAISSSTGAGGANTVSAVGAKQIPTPSISLLPTKPGTSTTTTPTAAHQQNKFGAAKTSPVVSAIPPPPFPTHFQKPSAGNVTTSNITPTVKAGTTVSKSSTTTTLTPTVGTAATVTNKTSQLSANPMPLTKEISVSSPAPATQSAAVTSAVTPTSSALTTATSAPPANNGNAVFADNTITAQKATTSTPTATTSPINAEVSTAAVEKNAKSTKDPTSAPDAAKYEEVAGNVGNKATNEKKIVVPPAKSTKTDSKTETNVNASISAKKTNPAIGVEDVNKSPMATTATGKSFVKTNAAGGGNKAAAEGRVDDINIIPNKSKAYQSKESTAKDQEINENVVSKAVAGARVEEKLESEKILATTGENANKQRPEPETQSAKTAKTTEKNSTTPTATCKREDGEKSAGKIKETLEQKSPETEKIELAKHKPTDSLAKNSTADADTIKQTNLDKKETSTLLNEAKSPTPSTIAGETKSKEVTPVGPSTAALAKLTDFDKRKVAATDKHKDEKIKNTKSEKISIAAGTAATAAPTSSTMPEPSAQGNSNKHTATTKITKSKATEVAPDSTNSSMYDATCTSTSAKRSARHPKIPVPKPIETSPVEKIEKVSSSSRPSKKLKSGISSGNSNNTSSTVAADVSVSAAPATPKPEQQTPSTSASDRKSSRHRLKTIPFQSPLPELAYITKLSASEASNSPKPMSTEDKLIVFYKSEYMAVRNAEGTFYLCQAMQNVYRTSPRISIRWLSEDTNNSGIYIPDFYDHTDIECVLTTVELKRVDKGHLSLPKKEQARIESILKKAIDVEKGIVPRPELTEENPDGLDISLYKDESQIEKKSATGATPTSIRKSRRSGNSIGGTPTAKYSASGCSYASKGLKRGRSSVGTDTGVKSSSKKRKSAAKRKPKSKKKSITDDENESSDDSDAEYKPNQKNKSSASKSSPRAQRSPLARARAASPITSTTARSKNVPTKLTPTASSRGERANKRKAAADATTPTTEYTPAKKGSGVTSTASATPNASKSTNPKSKTQDSVIEANNSASVAKKAGSTTTITTTADPTNVVSSTTNANNTSKAIENVTTDAANSNSGGNGGASNNNRPIRGRK